MHKILWLILAFLAPPIVVAILEGFKFHFWLNLILWLLTLSIGAIIHAWYLVLTRNYALVKG